MSATPVRKIAYITAKPGYCADLREALHVVEAATVAEPGCREFRFYQALSAPERFLLVEHFENEAAFKLHLQLPHTQAFFARQLVASIDVCELPPAA